MSTPESFVAAPATASAAPSADGAPPATDPLADFPEDVFTRFNRECFVVRTPPKLDTVDPLKVTAEDLIFDLDVDGYPVLNLLDTMFNNGYSGPIFVCPKALFNRPGTLIDMRPRARNGAKKTGSTPFEHACELLSKHRVPDSRHLDENGQWPRLRPAKAVTAGDVEEVWLQPCAGVKRMFLLGWALENPHDGNRRWFFRNPDLECLRDWVPEKVALPSSLPVPQTGGMQLFV